MKELRSLNSVFSNKSALATLFIAVLFGFALAVITPSRDGIRDFVRGLQSRDSAEETVTVLEEPTSLEVESGYYQISIQYLPIPKEVLDELVVKGRVVQYLSSINEDRFAVVVGSNSLPLGIQPASALEIEHESVGATMLIGSIEDSSVSFQSKSANLTNTIPSLSQVRDLKYLGNGQFLVSNVDTSEDCFALELWRFELDFEELIASNAVRLFRSEPCISEAIQAAETGGRISILRSEASQILLSVGSFGISTPFDLFGETFEERPDLLTPPSPYGSTVLVSANGTTRIFSSGHRNIQGLFQDTLNGDVWATEQGPRGGDELNLLTSGADYGWPDESIGTSYLGPRPANQFQIEPWASRHSRFTRPIYSWVPSVAPSAILRYEGAEFSLWNGDLLVTTLRDQSLRRLRLVDNHVLMDERIEVGSRIRDLIVLADGKLLASLDDGNLATLQLSTAGGE